MQNSIDAMKCFKILKVAMIPKCHLMLHWAQRSLQMGNPAKYNTYGDEHTNRDLARFCATAHATKFTQRSLTEFRGSITKKHLKPFERKRKAGDDDSE
jgi:hypothetical protein